MEVSQFLNGAISVLVVPDFLNVVQMFSQDDLKSALEMTGLSFLEGLKLVLGLDGNGFANFGLFHSIRFIE